MRAEETTRIEKVQHIGSSTGFPTNRSSTKLPAHGGEVLLSAVPGRTDTGDGTFTHGFRHETGKYCTMSSTMSIPSEQDPGNGMCRERYCKGAQERKEVC